MVDLGGCGPFLIVSLVLVAVILLSSIRSTLRGILEELRRQGRMAAKEGTGSPSTATERPKPKHFLDA